MRFLPSRGASFARGRLAFLLLLSKALVTRSDALVTTSVLVTTTPLHHTKNCESLGLRFFEIDCSLTTMGVYVILDFVLAGAEQAAAKKPQATEGQSLPPTPQLLTRRWSFSI